MTGSIRLQRSSRPADLAPSAEEQLDRLRLLETEWSESHWFLKWGPTTDDCLTLVFGPPSGFRVAFQLRTSHAPSAHTVDIPTDELISTLETATTLLAHR